MNVYSIINLVKRYMLFLMVQDYLQECLIFRDGLTLT